MRTAVPLPNSPVPGRLNSCKRYEVACAASVRCMEANGELSTRSISSPTLSVDCAAAALYPAY